MSERQVYLIGHCEVDPAWKSRGLPLSPFVSPPDYYKIGVGENPEKRVATMQTGTPHELKLITTIDSDDPADVEQMLHGMYHFSHQRGEWYKLTSNTVNSLKALDFIDSGILKSVKRKQRDWRFEKSLYIAYKEAENHE